MKTSQLPLFKTEETPQRDVDEAAQHIAENATVVKYKDRVSEAARDQGWGPADAQSDTEVVPTQSQNLVELPGRNGNNNWFNRPATWREREAGMSQEDIDGQSRTSHVGAAAAKAALNAHKPE